MGRSKGTSQLGNPPSLSVAHLCCGGCSSRWDPVILALIWLSTKTTRIGRAHVTRRLARTRFRRGSVGDKNLQTSGAWRQVSSVWRRCGHAGTGHKQVRGHRSDTGAWRAESWRDVRRTATPFLRLRHKRKRAAPGNDWSNMARRRDCNRWGGLDH